MIKGFGVSQFREKIFYVDRECLDDLCCVILARMCWSS